jgi:hypothetical protein
MFDGRLRTNANIAGEFTVGATRGQSGRWQASLRETLGMSVKPLVEVGINTAANDRLDWLLENQTQEVISATQTVKKAAGNLVPDKINGLIQRVTPQWIKEMVTTAPPVRMRPSILTFMGYLEWGAGDTLYSDVIFVNLNSIVNIQSGPGRQLNIFSLEGAPELLLNAGKTKITLPPGQMASFEGSPKPKTRTFKPEEIEKWWDQISKESKGEYDIPSIEANIESLKFFEQGEDQIHPKQRVYAEQFSIQTSRYICWELRLEYPKKKQRIDFEILAKYYNPDGGFRREGTLKSHIKKGWIFSWHSSGRGWKEPGHWKPGKYHVDLFIKDLKIASDYFEVY